MEEDTLGARLRKARKEVALTQQELSKRSGVSQQAISNIEAGRRVKVRADTTTRLESVLKRDLRDPSFSQVERRPAEGSKARLMETLEFEKAMAERYPILKMLSVNDLQDLTDLVGSREGRESVNDLITLKRSGRDRLATAAKIIRALVE